MPGEREWTLGSLIPEFLVWRFYRSMVRLSDATKELGYSVPTELLEAIVRRPNAMAVFTFFHSALFFRLLQLHPFEGSFSFQVASSPWIGLYCGAVIYWPNFFCPSGCVAEYSLWPDIDRVL